MYYLVTGMPISPPLLSSPLLSLSLLEVRPVCVERLQRSPGWPRLQDGGIGEEGGGGEGGREGGSRRLTCVM